jgi:L-methionine (R)-S-oxide reductase
MILQPTFSVATLLVRDRDSLAKAAMSEIILLKKISKILQDDLPRPAKAKAIAEVICAEGSFRWTGLYDVDMDVGVVSNIAWSGAAPPEYPTFPVMKGLTSRAIAARSTVNVGNVAGDADYLTALPTTCSEIIIPVLAPDGRVIGTLDVESEIPNAFNAGAQRWLEECARLLTRLWPDRAN